MTLEAPAATEDIDLSGAPTGSRLSKDLDDVEEAASLMSGVKADLVDWSAFARPAESLLVGLLLVVMVLSLNGGDWLSGANDHGKMVKVGLSMAVEEGSPPFDLVDTCEKLSYEWLSGNATSVACALSNAAGSASTFGYLTFNFALLLGATFILESLARRGMLAPVAANLPEAMPYEKISLYLPTICWSLLLIFDVLALLLYAMRSPPSLGGGYVRFGFSYGLCRLGLLLSLTGFTVNISLVHKLGEDPMVATLDALKGHWSNNAKRQQATQLLLFVALICELILWVRRVEYGAMVLGYGLYAYTHHDHDHLCVFCALALFSLATDALTLAADDGMGVIVPLFTWSLIVSKSTACAMMIWHREAFA